MISVFNDLLEMANEQPDPQRLLFLFASAKATNKSKKRDDRRGEITPVMVVDKLPNELHDFTSLINEADSINNDWDFVFIASLGGDANSPPTSEDAEPYLNKMTDDVMQGNNIARYVVFDREENPIEMVAN